MFEWLYQQVMNNQLAQAGIATMISGAVVGFFGYLIRGLPSRILTHIIDFTTTTVTFELAHLPTTEYTRIAMFVDDHRFQNIRRSFSVRRMDSRDPVRFAAATGDTYGIYEGVLFKASRMVNNSKYHHDENLTIRFLTRKKDWLRTEMDSVMSDPADEIFLPISIGGYGWNSGPARIKRRLDSVFINTETRLKLRDALSRFYASEQACIERGLNWKFCALLEGEPGTGKSSLIQALASDYGWHVRYITRLSGITDIISSMSVDDMKRSVFVIEDIDTLQLGEARKLPKEDRQSEAPESHPGRGELVQTNSQPQPLFTYESPLHELLNLLDGMMTPHGLKIVCTTNNPDVLDAALLRSGRIDLRLNVGRLSFDAFNAMYYAFRNAEVPDDIRRTYTPQTGAVLQDAMTMPNPDERLRSILAPKVAAE